MSSPPSITPDAGLKRFFVSLPDLIQRFPTEVNLEDTDVLHHLRTVIRARPGERVVIVDDMREQAYEATIRDLERKTLSLTVERLLDSPNPRLPYVTLGVALIKEQRWDWLLQKTTELGVRAIQPLMAERCVVKLKPLEYAKKTARWQAVLKSAAEQSEGLFIPQVLHPVSVTAFCTGNHAAGLRLLLRERGSDRQSLREYLDGMQPGQPVFLAVGPEGGWTSEEVNCFATHGFQPASLGERILRSETAAISAMAAIMVECS